MSNIEKSTQPGYEGPLKGPANPYDIHTTVETFREMEKWVAAYDDIFPVQQASRSAPAFVINDADVLKHILVSNHKNYLKGVMFERVKMLLGHGIIVSDGTFWRRQRRMIQPAFGRDVIAQISERMKQCNLRIVAQWQQQSGQTINITELTNELALEIILRAIFGDDYEDYVIRDGKNPFAILTENSARDMQLVMRFRELRTQVQEAIDHRRNHQKTCVDFLQTFIDARDKDTGESMSDKEMIDEIMTLIVAGSETSAATMNWVWFLMAQHPEIETQVHAEVDQLQFTEGPDFEQVMGLKYVRQVAEEALRLYPPVWLYSRKAIEDDQVGDFKIPAGADIFISPYFLHRNTRYWSDPEKVEPERFSDEQVKQRHKFCYLPFSAGPRRCIGDFFGIVETQVHFAILAKQFRLTMPAMPEVKLEPEVNLRPAQPFLMTIEKRND